MGVALCSPLLSLSVCLDLFDSFVQAESNEQLSSFMFGLNQLLSSSGRDVVVDEHAEALEAARLAQQESAAAAAAAADKRSGNTRRFSILEAKIEDVDQESRHAHFKRTVLSLPADQNLRAMESGHTAELFTFDPAQGGALVKNTQHVWFQTAKEFGSICWSDSIKNRNVKAEKEMQIAAITDVFGQRETRERNKIRERG